MKRFNSTRALVLSAAVAVAALSAQTVLAQQTDQTAAPASAAPTEPAPAAEATTAAPPAAPAPAAAVAKLNEIGAPPEGKGQVVFFRPSRFVGMAVSFSVREGDTGIGKLTNGSYFVHVTDPGVKEYNISFEARDTLRMEVEEGETYYVVESISMGVIAARPNLTPSTEEAFQEKALKVTKAKATDRK